MLGVTRVTFIDLLKLKYRSLKIIINNQYNSKCGISKTKPYKLLKFNFIYILIFFVF